MQSAENLIALGSLNRGWGGLPPLPGSQPHSLTLRHGPQSVVTDQWEFLPIDRANEDRNRLILPGIYLAFVGGLYVRLS